MQSLSSHTRNIAVGSSLLILGVLHVHGPAAALDSVSLITDFGYNGRHAYFFVALDKGYYKDAGLDVKILRGQGSVDAIRQVGANNATFGFADAGSLVLARGNDRLPGKLPAIVYAKPPQGVFCREDSGFKQPKDLEGASIANPAAGATVDMFPLYAKAAGIDARKVRGRRRGRGPGGGGKQRVAAEPARGQPGAVRGAVHRRRAAAANAG